MKLTKTECDRLQPKQKSYKRFDGGGLYLEVTPKGAKLWRLKYYFQGREKRLSLGKYPIVTLVEARKKREEAKQLLNQNIDPSLERAKRTNEVTEKFNTTFENIAREWHRKQDGRWGEKRSRIVMQRLEKNIFPYLGKFPITEIKPVLLLDALQRIEDRGSYHVAQSTRQICGQVFRYAIQTSRCEHNPALLLHGALKSRPIQHFAALDLSELPEFIDSLNNNTARLFERTRNAIIFSMLTFCRPGEIRQARWCDINFDDREWIIPAEFMKSGKSHIVPLSKQSMQILNNQRQESGHLETLWLFPARNNFKKPMSDGTVNVAIKKLGFHKRMTAHGFRALARTAIRERLGYYPDIIEAQLAHKPMGPLGGAYDRAQFLEKRKEMMQDWGDLVEGKGIKIAHATSNSFFTER